MSQKIQNIIVKYFNNEANFDELESLESWLKDKSNVPLFNTYAKTDYVTNLIMSEYDLENAKNEIIIKISFRTKTVGSLKFSLNNFFNTYFTFLL